MLNLLYSYQFDGFSKTNIGRLIKELKLKTILAEGCRIL